MPHPNQPLTTDAAAKAISFWTADPFVFIDDTHTHPHPHTNRDRREKKRWFSGDKTKTNVGVGAERERCLLLDMIGIDLLVQMSLESSLFLVPISDSSPRLSDPKYT